MTGYVKNKENGMVAKYDKVIDGLPWKPKFNVYRTTPKEEGETLFSERNFYSNFEIIEIDEKEFQRLLSQERFDL